MPIPKKSCPAIIDCEECCWYREWDYSNKMTGEKKRDWRCSIEILLEYVPKIEGAFDGCQQAANKATNEAVKTQGMLQALGTAIGSAFAVIEKRIDMVVNENLIEQHNQH